MPCPPHCAPLVPWPALGRAAQGSRLVLLTQLRGCALGARGVRRPTRAARFLVRVWGNLTREPLKMEHARQAAQWTCGAAHDFAVGRRPSSPSSSSRGAKAGGDADDALCPADPACFAPACSPCPSPTGSAPRDTAASWCESASSSRVSDFHHWTKASLCVRFRFDWTKASLCVRFEARGWPRHFCCRGLRAAPGPAAMPAPCLDMRGVQVGTAAERMRRPRTGARRPTTCVLSV